MTNSEKTRRALLPSTFAAAAALAGVMATAPLAASAQEDAARIDAIEAPAARIPSEIEDPMVSEEVDRLDRAGLIQRQSRIGEDILVLDRDIRRAEAVKALVAQMGYEAFSAAYPDLAASFAESPILLQAEIDALALQRELDRARKGETEAPEAPARTAPRSDGSDFFQIPVQPSEARAPVEPPAETGADVDAAVDIPATAGDRDIPISLREIYGSTGRFFAVIAHGTDRIRVEAGDELPGDTMIEDVGENWIDVKRRGETVRIFIRG